MKWYVRTESGDVRGPLHKKDAEFERDRLDGVMFNERIFEPEFVTTPEVDTLIAEMRSSASMRPTMPNHIFLEAQGLLTRAIDTITLLCKKPQRDEITVTVDGLEMPIETSRLLLDLDKVLVGDLRELAARTILSLSAKKVVTGNVEGGVLTLEDVPDGVKVEINDYDVVGDEDNLEKDEAGRSFSPCRWGT